MDEFQTSFFWTGTHRQKITCKKIRGQSEHLVARNLYFLYCAATGPEPEHFSRTLFPLNRVHASTHAHHTRSRSIGANNRRQEHQTASLATFGEKEGVCIRLCACVRVRVHVRRCGGRLAHVR